MLIGKEQAYVVLERIFSVSRQSVLKWLEERVQHLPTLRESLKPKERGDVLELNEAWSFVFERCNKRWSWTALCRRTRQIVSFVIGDRDEATCKRFWDSIPPAYRRCRSYSDFLKAYLAVLPKHTHPSVGKETRQTAHQERWYNTLRQRVGRFTRKTLSFFKTDKYHELTTRWFIIEYNLAIQALLIS